MAAKLIKGTEIREEILAEIKEEVLLAWVRATVSS